MEATLGIMFDDLHTLRDWGLHWESLSISPPVARTNYIEVPGRRVPLDASDSLFGRVTYGQRTITAVFWKLTTWPQHMALESEIQNAIAGKRVHIFLDTEPDVYWIGRPTVTFEKTEFTYSKVTVEIVCEPYKYESHTSDESWIWDDFNLESGIIRGYRNISVNGSGTITVIGSEQPVTPTVTATEEMTLVVNDREYTLLKDTPKKLVGTQVTMKPTSFVFQGTGTVTIQFRGERL